MGFLLKHQMWTLDNEKFHHEVFSDKIYTECLCAIGLPEYF